MLKKWLPVIAGCFMTLGVSAQTHRCGTQLHMEYKQSVDPSYAARVADADEAITAWLMENKPNLRGGDELYTIPVVVHVLWSSPSQNISDAQILSQIDILNADFQRLNADTVDTPDGFKSVAGSLPIQFCMAQRDPLGEPTTGIERRETDVTTFDWTDDMKSFASGGLDAWDPTRYFNIWVCNLSFGLLGYAEFPTGTVSDTYGVAVDYLYFGNIGTATSPYDEGRTSTHEIGHCFNLRHIWGDDGSGCGGSDLVDDTPNQANENYGCPGFPETDACTPDGDGVMFMNYMDYTDDDCMNMFTAGQADRMWAAIENFYPELLESDGCIAVELFDHDAAVTSVDEPFGLYCEGSVTPSVLIRNWGATTLTSVDIEYQIDGGAVSTYAWTGSLASLAYATVELPVISLDDGTYTLQVEVVNPNGVSDMNPLNDLGASTFSIYTAGAALPIVEGFESEAFPDNGWGIQNEDGDITWQRTEEAASLGDAASWIDNYNFGVNNREDDLISIPFDLTDMVYPIVTFDVAYAVFKQGVTEREDELQVLVSTDCGETGDEVYSKEGEDLETRSPTSAFFIPTSSQWRNDTILLADYAGESFISLVFRNVSGAGNNLYIDNINIQEGNINDNIVTPLQQFVQIYPVPASEVLFLQWNGSQENGMLEWRTITGQMMGTFPVQAGQADRMEIAVGEVPDGVYTLIFRTDSGKLSSTRWVVQHP